MSAFHGRNATVLQIQAWALRGRLFAIVDATETPSVPIKAREAGNQQAVSLYQGRAEESLSALAPYLFRVDAAILEWIAGDLWTEPWGIFVLADQSLDQLRRHFRKFLVVEAPDGGSWYFRFYDPRVLVKYLAGCTAAEATEFLGPVRAFAVTDLETYGVKILAPGDTPVMPAAAPAQPVLIRR